MKAIIQASFRKMMMLSELLEGFRKLKTVNREEAFQTYREQYLELIFVVITSFALFDFLAGQLFDYLKGQPNLVQLLLVRAAFIGVVAANFSVYLFLSNRVPVRWFVYSGFYLFTIFSPVVSSFTGGITSPYWFEMIFVLVAWFMMIPFSYKKLGLHAIILITIYSSILFLLIRQPINWMVILEHGSVFAAVFLLGMMVAIFNNLFSASVFISEQRIAKSEQRFRMFTQNSLDVV